MCWDRHCWVALWSTTGWRLWLLESTAVCLLRLLCPSTMTVKVLVPNLSILSVDFSPLPISRGAFKWYGVNLSSWRNSPVLCASPSWLTFNSEARLKRAKEHQIRLTAGAHSEPDHSPSHTSTSISCWSPLGLQAPLAREVSSRLWV